MQLCPGVVLSFCSPTCSMSLKETLGDLFKEAPELVHHRQLSFLWRACHSITVLILDSGLWQDVDTETRIRIMVLTYVAHAWIFKS